MLKNLFRAFLVFRLEFRQPSLDFSAFLGYWRRTPLIQQVVEEEGEKRSSPIVRKLDKVFPF